MLNSRSRWPRALALAVCALAIGFAARTIFQPPPARAQSPTPTPLPDLILDGGRAELGGRHVFGRVVLKNRARLEIKPYSGTTNSGQLELVATHIEIDRTSTIIGNFAGYRGELRGSGEGPGGGEGGAGTADGGGGGGYGGEGGDGVLDNSPAVGALGGKTYGTNCGPDLDLGSAGGAPGRADNRSDPGVGGNGGAALSLIADTVLITGTITLNGDEGIVAANDAAGGGSGGGLLVRAGTLSQTGRIEADGGDGGETDDGGGGGGGGRIKLFYGSGVVTRRALSVAGGKGDGNGHRNDGQIGTICIETLPTATPTQPASDTATPTLPPTDPPTDPPTQPASDTATPTLPPTDTPTASPTSTAAPSHTPTSPPTAPPTATPTPAPVYLPILLRQKCPIVDPLPVALALVIDASESMRGPTRAGRTKIEAAIEAARVPVDLLAVDRGDQMTVVVFNAGARVIVPLTNDRAALNHALSQVSTAPGSRLEAGVARAAAELAAVHPASARWIVVLTDGLPNPSSPADALAAADAARAGGIQIDTIGLGADVDASLLRRMASAPERYHEAPDAEDLAAIFADLVWRPPACVGDPHWP